MPNLVVGLTGGIGSGKSTVASLFADLGVPVIDTDQLARDVTLSDQNAFQAIVQEFGPDVITPSQQLDRRKLGKIIFADNTKRLWLENLLHPLIREEIVRQLALVPSSYAIVVIPLLFEKEPNPAINRILVVDTTENLQIERTLSRDARSGADIKLIMDAQASREKRLAGADDIIHNNLTLDDLVTQVDKLHKFYLSLAASSNVII